MGSGWSSMIGLWPHCNLPSREAHGGAMPNGPPTRDERDCPPTDPDLDRLSWTTALYYLHETNPDNGLVRDKTDPAAPCSIAAVGMALATLPIAIERGVMF